MRIRWRGLELPTKVELDKTVSTDKYGRLIIEPFERGFGITVGNGLRRVLLSSLEGSAITSVKIANAPHEFMSLPGVLEDVTDIILNIKSLVVKLDSDEPKKMTVRKNSAGQITGADIQADPTITIMNPDCVIATLTDNVEFSMEMTVEKGRGYIIATHDDKASEQEVGVIPVDALYSPVTRVRYKTEETRVGQKINYDRLIMEIWTDGTVSPEMALVESAKILRKHLSPFVQYFEMSDEMVEPAAAEIGAPVEQAVDEELRRKLNTTIADLELSVRANNCLEMAKIETVGQLVSMPESELLNLRSFGKTSLREVKRKLADMGLLLGMNLPAMELQHVAGDDSSDIGE
ncbi:MAG: DNA-directed RNA polymerase subunit alpha [Sedimentisphaerales bacterium]|nr:DNA-directed RNA polymerase subunit alpha [Sedimentisphaerales bacterium]